jgi:hypothetical protein
MSDTFQILIKAYFDSLLARSWFPKAFIISLINRENKSLETMYSSTHLQLENGVKYYIFSNEKVCLHWRFNFSFWFGCCFQSISWCINSFSFDINHNNIANIIVIFAKITVILVFIKTYPWKLSFVSTTLRVIIIELYLTY